MGIGVTKRIQRNFIFLTLPYASETCTAITNILGNYVCHSTFAIQFHQIHKFVSPSGIQICLLTEKLSVSVIQCIGYGNTFGIVWQYVAMSYFGSLTSDADKEKKINILHGYIKFCGYLLLITFLLPLLRHKSIMSS